jgi:hypothetical protein
MPIGGTAAFGINQHPRITTLYLNSLNRHGDPAPGLNVSTAEMSGSIAQPYGGFEGGKLTITNPWALGSSPGVGGFGDPAVGPVYGGIYQYLQVNLLDPDPLTRGQVVFWQDELRYIVTAIGIDSSTTPAHNRKIAGVAVNETFPGHWDFFQIAGIARVAFPAAGALSQFVIATPTATGSTISVAGTITINSIGMTVLSAVLAPVPPATTTLSPVELNIIQGWNF